MMPRRFLLMLSCCWSDCYSFPDLHLRVLEVRKHNRTVPGSIPAIEAVGPQRARPPSLFCFVVVTSELDFMLLSELLPALSRCDRHAIYSNVSMPFRQDETIAAIRGPAQVDIQSTIFGPIADNWPVFAQVWRYIAQSGPYRSADWIVKVDPDTVFFPERVRRVLSRLPTLAAQEPTVITNPCRPPLVLVNGCFFGGMMILSRGVVEQYLAHEKICDLVLASTHIAEDGYMHRCAAEHMAAKQVVLEGLIYAGYKYDQQCEAKDADSSSAWLSAFHPFKTVEAYRNCLRKASRDPVQIVFARTGSFSRAVEVICALDRREMIAMCMFTVGAVTFLLVVRLAAKRCYTLCKIDNEL
eukprot:TRINITY_DN46488_c0_g1_i1.p1 TRINITY_DN46488_c0_g1~~TRINITY_DN46488_c0_g1_i1.p1  ORF type:complete len:355 (+),score=47.79 TRINITY_DN46488_c0_g1_i1:37-1101(+)